LYSRLKNVNLWNGKHSQIFENMNAVSPNISELKTLWAALEHRELKALTTCPPANVFSRTDSLDRARKIVEILY